MTEAERKAYEVRISAALSADSGVMFSDAAAAVSIADLRKLFCDNWPMVKSVLQALGSIFPPAALVTGLVIKIGDTAHGIICP